MNRSFDIFRMGANGIDPDRGTGRTGQMRARTTHSAEPPFDHGIHHHPDEWGPHGRQQQQQAYGGFVGDHERFADESRRYADDQDRYRRETERHDEWRRTERDFDRNRDVHRYTGGMHEMAGYPHTNYGNTAGNEPYPSAGVAWRGRNEDQDFWGQDRHSHEDHPSLWQRMKGAFSGRGPKNYVRSDDRIHEDVCEHLTHHPYVDASDIEVTVRDGEVTLSGTVEARMTKRAAEEACDHVRGVKDVHNHLRVKPRVQNP